MRINFEPIRFFNAQQGSVSYGAPQSAGGNFLVGANSGVTLDGTGTIVQLGQPAGAIGNPGILLHNTEIPLGGFSLLTSQVGQTATGIPVWKADAAKAITTPFFLFQDSAGTELLRINSFATGASNNTMFGAFAGNAIAAGAIRNTLIGYEAGKVLTTGTRNTFVGWDAGPSLTTGSGNVFIGHAAGQVVTTGSNNTAVGSTAMQGVATTSNNSAFGNGALNNNTGSNNTAIGFQAYQESTVASNGAVQNTMIGASAGQQKTWGNNNFIGGFKCGFATTGGQNNVVISPNGFISGDAFTDNNVMIGGTQSVTGGGSALSTSIIWIGANITSNGGTTVTNSTVIGQGITCNSSNIVILGRADQNVILGTTASPVDLGSKLQVLGSVAFPIRVSGVNTTLDATDYTLILTAGGLTVTLPAANTAKNRIYRVINQGAAGTFSINYIAFNGAASNTIVSNGDTGVQSDGTNWYRTV